ncbi:MAG TPA: AMP-binding protein [bacterium]|nr:AMP-binding protein [bacterium]
MPEARDRFWDRRIETLSRPALEALQLERLQRQVARCYDGSPFYREKFDRAGVAPRHLARLSDLARFPFVTKQELRDEQAAHPPFGRYLLAPAGALRELHPSSGTTGHPVNTIWSASDVEVITDHTARTMWSFGTRPGDVVQNAFAYGLWVAGMAVHYAAARIGAFCLPAGTTPAARQIEMMTRARATVLLATPSFGLYIGERLRATGQRPDALALQLGCFGGEAGTELPSTRARLERSLGIDAYDYYGLAEIGPTFASECDQKAGLHWAEDHYLVEIVDPDTRQPLPPGEQGIVVITHLTREATPMIRYWTNDYARLDLTPCRCGRTHARSPQGIVARNDDLVVFRGAKFYPVQVEQAVRAFAELSDEFRIELETERETGLDRCTVIVEAGTTAAAPDLPERVRRALREALLVSPAVAIVPPGSLERTEFKAKRVLDRRPRAASHPSHHPAPAGGPEGAHS